jgi:hypothetical protein
MYPQLQSEPWKGLRILALAPVGGYGGNNTSRHRIEALISLGCDVEVVDSSTKTLTPMRNIAYQIRSRLFRGRLPVDEYDYANTSSRLLALLHDTKRRWDMIWLERALSIDDSVLRRIRMIDPKVKIVGFSPDDMNSRHNQSCQFLRALPCYDVYVTTKSYNVDELHQLGCPRVLFVGNGFDPNTFRPLPVSPEDERKYGGDVGFIGTFERERADLLEFLASAGLSVRVWGNGWNHMKGRQSNLKIEGRPLYGDDFARACAAFKINLCFLRKQNRDLQTTRSVEIPACGGFMLAERTQEHLDMFEEGMEAEFFATRQELLTKCRFFLQNDDKRQAIAKAGRARCIQSEYSNAARLSTALREVFFSEYCGAPISAA